MRARIARSRREKRACWPPAIVRVENHFAPMDVVSIVDAEGREFARGIANCASERSGKSSRARKTGRGGPDASPAPVSGHAR